MKTHPMLFSGPMIRALLDGRKTQTRRVIKPQPVSQGILEFGEAWAWSWPPKNDIGFRGFTADQICRHGAKSGMSKIQVGDLIWARETWSDVNCNGAPGIAYRADESVWELMEEDDFLEDDGSFNYADPRLLFGKSKHALPFADWESDLLSGIEGAWRTSIHMPRWISRITLEVTDVRIQRLQDISAKDATEEGIERLRCDGLDGFRNYLSADPMERVAMIPSFKSLWNSINGPDAWDQNPWVVAYSFIVHQCNVDQMGEAA